MAKIKNFISVGENIHCTRIYKVGGKFVKTLEDGSNIIAYQDQGTEKHLPIPGAFVAHSDWGQGKLKHAAVAIWQGMKGDEAAQEAGKAYLRYMVRRQEENGATYLDLNVDEYTTDVDERREVIQWAAQIIQKVASVPLSIDSSNENILDSGLAMCDPKLGKPMVNSVSLERQDAIAIAQQAGAVVIAAATGETSMPTDKTERLENLTTLVQKLTSAGLNLGDIHLDPLVFPVSVDPGNGTLIIETIKELRQHFGPEIHFAPGLSNISYGMPNRKLLNQVYTYLCAEKGLDGGIVDPLQINADILNQLDTSTESFALARAFLVGEDQYGMNYIGAVRGGTL